MPRGAELPEREIEHLDLTSTSTPPFELKEGQESQESGLLLPAKQQSLTAAGPTWPDGAGVQGGMPCG